MELEQIEPLAPLAFYEVETTLAYGKKPQILPDFSELLAEERFAEVRMGWTEKGFQFYVDIDKPFEEIVHPDFTSGDSIEIFIRALGFYHHFLFLPANDEGLVAEEVTRLRSIDVRPLADPALLHVRTDHKKKSYAMEIEIEAEAVKGFEEAREIGFNYRINRYRGEPQHFSLSSHEFAFEKHPELWSLITKKR